MTEIEKIKTNINGEIPGGKYDVLQVTDIDNPGEVLDNFKKSIIAIIQNDTLEYNDKKWEALLPEKIVQNVARFDEEDYKNDELVCSLKLMVYDVKSENLKEWTWFSSKLKDNGFDVYFQGIFRARFTSFIRFQGVLLSKIIIFRNGTSYPIHVYKDVVSYKTF